jgi:hypothetical protein
MEADEAKKYDVELSYLEVYNESLRDLLSPSTPLPLREDNEKGMVVVGLSKHKPKVFAISVSRNSAFLPLSRTHRKYSKCWKMGTHRGLNIRLMSTPALRARTPFFRF